jgi:RNA polymerase sigma factor (sigma-70 family)
MTGTAARMQREPKRSSDEQLVAQCLKGNEEAWSALIDKYKNLIYSIPVKMGMYQDAADIFQAVCLELLKELPKLREARALPKWLMQTCYHKSLRHKKTSQRQVQFGEEEGENQIAANDIPAMPEEMLAQLEREQLLRNALAELPPRCAQMIRMLFFEIPPRPYHDIAKQLGLASGSIGFIRGRCLNRLKKYLEKMGF